MFKLVISYDLASVIQICFGLKVKDILLQIAAIVGGLALPKQQRILKRCPDILVATPGRLWELIQQVLQFVLKLSHFILLLFLIISVSFSLIFCVIFYTVCIVLQNDLNLNKFDLSAFLLTLWYK